MRLGSEMVRSFSVKLLVSLATGLLFGLGLVVSGMSNPAKVLNFLDFTGAFDPSLAFVMAGAVVVAFVGYRVARFWRRPWFDERFHAPTAAAVDGRLVGGAALFGVGWGLSGYCPGPAIVGVGLGEPGTLVFVAAMLLGLWAARFVEPRDPG